MVCGSFRGPLLATTHGKEIDMPQVVMELNKYLEMERKADAVTHIWEGPLKKYELDDSDMFDKKMKISPDEAKDLLTKIAFAIKYAV